MHVTAICPTYRHPKLLANSLALWLLQDYDPAQRQLVILDDAQTFDNQYGDTWQLRSLGKRCTSITQKYNMLLDMMGKTEAVIVWEDDDTYLPDYVSKHVAALQKGDYSKPSRVLSDYTGKLVEENAAVRFHSSIAFTDELIFRVGSWPDTKRADFDQQLMSKLTKYAGKQVDPWPTGPIPFVYRWHTGAAHGQNTMQGPDDETWWDRNVQSYAPVDYVGKLVPSMDGSTFSIFKQLGYQV